MCGKVLRILPVSDGAIDSIVVAEEAAAFCCLRYLEVSFHRHSAEQPHGSALTSNGPSNVAIANIDNAARDLYITFHSCIPDIARAALHSHGRNCPPVQAGRTGYDLIGRGSNVGDR